MKRINVLLLSIIVLLSFSCANSSSEQKATEDFAVDAAGMIYEGKIVFSETESMAATVFLLPDSLFFILKKVNNDSIWEANTGVWRITKGQLLLDGGNDSRLVARKTSEGLEVLNNAGEPVMKDKKFILKQQPVNSLWEYEFRLTAAYSYLADAALMHFCDSPKAVPVLQTKANIDAERVFLNTEKQSEKGLFMDVSARLLQNSQTENPFKFALELEAVEQVFAEMECY
ncbi:MAG: hypothetical protein RBR87_07665 [Bacteroidales bacterium]|jgi:hypothetical protein|nr:hypothetical protein [Bacteroidales bacterium]